MSETVSGDISEYGNPNVGHHTDAKYRGLDGRDGSLIGGMSASLPNVKHDRAINSIATISADASQQSPTRSEGDPKPSGMMSG